MLTNFYWISLFNDRLKRSSTRTPGRKTGEKSKVTLFFSCLFGNQIEQKLRGQKTFVQRLKIEKIKREREREGRVHEGRRGSVKR